MIAGLLADQSVAASFVSPRTRNGLILRETGRNSTNALCRSPADGKRWSGFRDRGVRQYPFCAEAYSAPARSIHLRPPATRVETYV
jgi:hypothetical protein